ncbi:MAG: ArsA family ATPase [Leptolyngbyaceae cyanobacterium SL_7_1]|nr:ArsA family ATPase [Leptolyngbyaceae cyanobacterium SL_7_1]
MTLEPYQRLSLALISGKGGVGKTTLSCGLSRQWAQQFPQEEMLLISTDPAHSLGDVLQMAVGDTPVVMADLPNLRIRALDAEALLQAFKTRYGTVLECLVERGSFVEGSDLSPVWNLSWPGLDELMGILEIQRLLREPGVDRVVVDMAPSGHTLNLLGLMDFLDEFLNALDLFQQKHRAVSQGLTGRYVPDDVDQFLVDMKADLAAGRQLLQDGERTACLVVAIAESMSFQETQRFLTALKPLHIPVGGVFVNQVTGKDDAIAQKQLLQQFCQLAEPNPVVVIPQQVEEPVGAIALDRLMTQMQPVCEFTGWQSTLATVELPAKEFPSLSDFVAEGRRLLIVGGKGGVGKTTVAAAIAWGMAAHYPDRSVRVISIDPAHSLGDALGSPLNHAATALTANLTAQEIDAKILLEQFRQDYLWELAEMMSGATNDDTLALAYTPQAWRQLVAQALPGIDQMLALISVMEQLEANQQDLIVLDTAPTGHLLRFLEMPMALGDWLAWIFKLWLKYQDVAGHTQLIDRLRSLRRRLMQAQKRLLDTQHTEFIGVFQSNSAIVAETERLARSLVEKGVAQRYLIHNRYQVGQMLTLSNRHDHTIVRLPRLPRSIAPIEQVKAAATLLF